MRSCHHCAHENADHLAFCSQCGRKLPRTDGGLAAERFASDPTGYSRTIMATPHPVSTTGRATVSGARLLSDRNLAALSSSGFEAASPAELIAKWMAFLAVAERGVYVGSYRGAYIGPESALEHEGGALAA